MNNLRQALAHLETAKNLVDASPMSDSSLYNKFSEQFDELLRQAREELKRQEAERLETWGFGSTAGMITIE